MTYMNPALTKSSRRLSTSVRLGVAAVAACFISAQVVANPLNPTVINGAATFNQAGNVLTVTNSNGAIINWDKFSIQAGETTHFAQTAASSTVLNRVLNDPTAIYGTLSSNGQVWLVNPAGIMVGPGGRIDVAGFVASTLNIRNEDFLAGRHLFVNDGTAKDVINQGEIRTPAGGSVYLIGSNVANEGIITTPGGETILAAGATVSLIDSATPGVKVDITGAEGNATNLGTITAEAGRIGIAGVIVRNSGTLNASSVVNEGGRIFLKASQDAYVDGNGRIVTTGTRGGSVEVLGNRVAVMDSAEIDASGTNGGGRIMVGGDFQGNNPDIQNASITWFGPDATLKADATEVGDGGTVIVWADDTTRAYGSISARGGATGGNGGFVETSGKQYLDVAGIKVSTAAANGMAGTWLLDPTDITIVHATSSSGATFTSTIFENGGGATATLNDFDINSNLASNSITISTSSGYGGPTGNITFDASAGSGGAIIITNGTGTGRTLTLTADNDVIFYGGTTTFQTTASGSLGINFNPGAGRRVDVQSGATALFDGFDSAGVVAAYIGGAATGRSWENFGTVNLNGFSYIDLYVDAFSTFNNNTTGILNINSSAGWSFVSEGSQAGPINNHGNVNIYGTNSGFYTAWEAQYNQSPTGTLTIGAGKFLSMQNAGTIYGGVAIGADGRLIISEVHDGARTFYNASIAGPGMLDLAQSTTFVGSTMSNGILGKSNGAFSVPGSGLAFSGAMTFVSNSNVGFGLGTYNLGSLTVLAGWDGSGFTSADVIPGTGDINISGSNIFSAGAVNLWAGRDILLSNNGSTGTWIQGATMDVRAGRDLKLTGGSGFIGAYGAGVMLYSAGTQDVYAARDILLTAGNANNTYAGSPLYGGSVVIEAGGDQFVSAQTITLVAGTAGHDNVAAIWGGGGAQNINVTSQLMLTGGGGGNNNYASIEAYGNSTFQEIDATGANIILTGGNSGGAFDQENGADIGLGENNFSGSQTVYAGNITINGGSAAYGGAGFGTGNGLNQSFYVTGNLTMTGGGSNNADFRATPAYIGSEYGGGTIDVQVGGNIFLNGGSGTAGGVLIGSLIGLQCNDGCNAASTSVNLSAGKNIIAAGNTGGVWLGVKDLTGSLGSSVTLMAGTDNGFSGNTYGGNIEMVGPGGTHIQTDASGSVSLTAFQATADNGNITQNAGSIISGGYVSFRADGNLTLNGGTFASNSINAVAGIDSGYSFGYGYNNSPYGGDISIGGQLQAVGYIEIFALSGGATGMRGNITQVTGSTINGSDIAMGAWGNVDLSGTVSATNNLGVTAGIAIDCGDGCYSSSYASPLGGNVFIRNGGYVSGNSVDISANVGYGTYGNGNITQYGGSSIVAGNDINIVAGGSVSLGGTVSVNLGYLSVKAGYQAGYFGSGYGYGVTPYGGNISVSGTLSGYYGVQLVAESGYQTGLNGSITQSAGSITATSGDVVIKGDGDVTLGGAISSPSGNFLGYAGFGNTAAHSLSLGQISVDGYMWGESSGSLSVNGPLSAATSSVHLFAGLAYGGGTLTVNNNITAATNIELDNKSGSILQNPGTTLSVGTATTSATYNVRIVNDYATVPTGSVIALDNVVIDPAATWKKVLVGSRGAILDNNGAALNIIADTISLSSQYGGAAGGLAISMDTSAVTSLTADVGSSATFGGISIRNSGTSPGSVNLTDQATYQSSANFIQNGDLTVGDGGTAISMMADDLALLSTGNMTIGSSGLSLAAAAYGSILIGAAGNLLLDGADIFPADYVDVGLAAGGSMTLTNGAYVHGENLLAVAGQEISLAYGSEIGAWQTALVAAGSGIRLEDSHIHSDYGDVFMVTGGDIRVNDGSSIDSGNSVYLAMNGGASTLYINEFAGLSPSWIHALNPNTIDVGFSARTSGGIVIDGVATTTTSGSSGFFVGSSMIPATAGAGLAITYTTTAATTVDPCVSNPDLCKPPSPTSTPFYQPPETLLPPDPTQPLEYPGYTIGGTEDSFGGEEEAGKKSDEAKDEKKDEKSAQKKVAQCSL